MKSIHKFAVLLLAGASLGGLAAPEPCSIERVQYRGWNAFKLSNGWVALYIAPEIGGRVIQYQLRDHPFFFVNRDLEGKVFPPEENGGDKGGWKNYGGDKLWPAPQGWENDGQWPGPPDPILDGGQHQCRVLVDTPEHVAVALSSPPDDRTGIRLGRSIHLFRGSTRVQVECTMKNIGLRRVRWSIWEVIQHDTADPAEPGRCNDDFWAYCPINPHSRHPNGFFPMFGQVNHPSYRPDPTRGLLAVRYAHRVGKIGLDSNAGWLAVVNGKTDHCFVGLFPFFPGADYPDGASVEFWLNGAGEFIINGQSIINSPDLKETPFLMETEILSPLANLAPGEEYQFPVEWFATRCPKPIVAVTPVAAVHRPLNLIQTEGRGRIDGVFGPFVQGRAQALFKGADGKIVGREDLGAVTPDEVLKFSRVVDVPARAFRMTIDILDEAGRNRGSLGNVILEEKR